MKAMTIMTLDETRDEEEESTCGETSLKVGKAVALAIRGQWVFARHLDAHPHPRSWI